MQAVSSSEPLPVTDAESKFLDEAIVGMVALAEERKISAGSLVYVSLDKDLCRQLDTLISETLTRLKTNIPVSPAEKLFERIMATLDSRRLSSDRLLGIIFVRYLDTMEYMVSFHKKFRGIERKSVKYDNDTAHKTLRMRGLTKR